MRLFVAVELPDLLRERLASLPRGLAGARPVPSERLHLTMRFLGEVDDTRVPEIREALTGIRARPFSLTPFGVGSFPPRGQPRIAWSGFRRSEQLAELQRSVEEAARAAGLAPEQRPFHPHVTVARLKGTSRREVRAWEQANASFEDRAFEVRGLTLFSSLLGPEGATHRRELTSPLESPT